MRPRIIFVAAILAAGGIAACSSGSSVPSTSVSGGSTSPGASSYFFTTLGSSSTTLALPVVSGTTGGTITIPTGTGTIAIEASTTTPNGTIQVQSLPQSAAGRTPLFYLSIAASGGPVTLSALPGFTVTLTTTPSGTIYESQAVQNGDYTYWGTIGSLLSASANTVTVPSISGSITLASGQVIYLAVYSGSVIPTPAAHPNALGDTFAYKGTLTNAGTYNYPLPNPSAPAGVPASMPPTSGTAQVTTAITVQASPTPFFSTTASVVDVHSVETDAFALRSNVTTTDAWFATSPTAYLLYGSSANDGAGDTFATQYNTPQTIDQLPEAAGSWTNSPAAVLLETDADGTTSTRTIAADGSYTDDQTVPLGYTADIVVNPDGSGSYTGTAFSTLARFNGFTFSAPVGGVVTIAVPTGPGTSITVATPTAFFSSSPTLYSESDVLTTDVAFSSNPSCAVPAQYGLTGNQIVQTISRIDPVLGYTETETVTTYDQPGVGPVCIAIFDTQNYYYNYNNDDGTILNIGSVFGNGSLQSVLTSSEVLNLQNTNAIVPTSAARRSQGASQTLAPSTVAYARAQFDAHLEKQRRQNAEALRTSLIRVLNRSGVK